MKVISELSIKKLVYGGYGLADHRGKKVFVRYAVPMELVSAEVIKEKKDHIEAVVKDIIVSSPWRRQAPCKYYTYCGGCQLQHIHPEKQVELKEDILLESLQRIAHIAVDRLGDSIKSGQEFGYRIKAQFKVQSGKLGFFAWGTHELVSIEECLLLHPAINGLIPSLRELIKKVKDLQELHVLYSPTEDEFLLKLITPTAYDANKMRTLKEKLLPKEVVGVGNYSKLGDQLIKRYHIGRNFTYMQVGKYRYRVSNDSFFQINFTLWEELIRGIVIGGYRKVVELHCGAGFFSIPMSEVSNFLLSSDNNPSAIRDAEYNAKLNMRDNVVFSQESAYQTLKNYAGEVIDLLFLDPPRSGLTTEETKLILQNRPREIIYVSCNPTTLARDIGKLTDGGYALKGIRLIDNFPQTYHIESVAYLSQQ
jgi:23S rRNA (uracil1939-C5)-methyltransferase